MIASLRELLRAINRVVMHGDELLLVTWRDRIIWPRPVQEARTSEAATQNGQTRRTDEG